MIISIEISDDSYRALNFYATNRKYGTVEAYLSEKIRRIVETTKSYELSHRGLHIVGPYFSAPARVRRIVDAALSDESTGPSNSVPRVTVCHPQGAIDAADQPESEILPRIFAALEAERLATLASATPIAFPEPEPQLVVEESKVRLPWWKRMFSAK